jgi:hypothetical protein
MSDPTGRDRGDDAAPQGRRPSDTERLVGDTASSEPRTTAPRVQPAETASRADSAAGRRLAPDEEDAEAELGHS